MPNLKTLCVLKYCNYTSILPSSKISNSATSIPILAIKSTNKNCNAITCKHGLIKEKANTSKIIHSQSKWTIYSKMELK